MPGVEQSPVKTDTAASAQTVRRHDDNVRFVERFEVLTGLRVHSTNLDGLPREFLAREVPAPDVLIEHYGYELERRTRNALNRYEPGRLRDRWTFGRLLELSGFGAFSLLDLLEVLAKHGIRNID
jgi:hypothetical protein